MAPAIVVRKQPSRLADVHGNVVLQVTKLLLQAISAIFRNESWGCATCSSWRSSPPQCSCGAGRAGRGCAAAAWCNMLPFFMQTVLMIFRSFLQRVRLVLPGSWTMNECVVEAFIFFLESFGFAFA